MTAADPRLTSLVRPGRGQQMRKVYRARTYLVDVAAAAFAIQAFKGSDPTYLFNKNPHVEGVMAAQYAMRQGIPPEQWITEVMSYPAYTGKTTEAQKERTLESVKLYVELLDAQDEMSQGDGEVPR